MLENILQGVISVIAKHLGWETSKLHEQQLITPEGWYSLALVCHVHLAEGFIFWRRPEQPRTIREIAEIIFEHNVAFAA